MKYDLIPFLTGIIFLLIGVICLFWPEKIQEVALKYSAQGLGRYNPFLSWMKTRSYILVVRIIGVIAIMVFLLALVAIFTRVQK